MCVTFAAVLAILSALFGALVAAFGPRASLVAENLVLRQQLAILKRERPRPSLPDAGDAPAHRVVEPPSKGRVVAMPKLGGLHHRYARTAA